MSCFAAADDDLKRIVARVDDARLYRTEQGRFDRIAIDTQCQNLGRQVAVQRKGRVLLDDFGFASAPRQAEQ